MKKLLGIILFAVLFGIWIYVYQFAEWDNPELQGIFLVAYPITVVIIGALIRKFKD